MTTATDTETRHASMVSALMKAPAELHDASTAWKWGLIHAAVGIAGELCEVDNAKDEAHLLEECGDTLFYCRDIRTVLDLPAFQPTPVPVSLTAMTSAILDHTKRLCIYNYAMDDKRLSAIHELVDEIESYISVALANAGYTRQDALEHNIEKLLTGPDARYKDGAYSDLAAQLRADKNPENDDV